MIYDIPDRFEIEARQINPGLPLHRQLRVEDIPVGYLSIGPMARVTMIATCTEDILDRLRAFVEKLIGGPFGGFTAPPQMVDRERERCEQIGYDEQPESQLWLPSSF